MKLFSFELKTISGGARIGTLFNHLFNSSGLSSTFNIPLLRLNSNVASSGTQISSQTKNFVVISVA